MGQPMILDKTLEISSKIILFFGKNSLKAFLSDFLARNKGFKAIRLYF